MARVWIHKGHVLPTRKVRCYWKQNVLLKWGVIFVSWRATVTKPVEFVSGLGIVSRCNLKSSACHTQTCQQKCLKVDCQKPQQPFFWGKFFSFWRLELPCNKSKTSSFYGQTLWRPFHVLSPVHTMSQCPKSCLVIYSINCDKSDSVWMARSLLVE